MASLPRILQKIFGLNASNTEMAQIGSLAAGSPLKTKDLAQIQALVQYLNGLFSITSNAGQPPRIEDINGLYYLLTSQLAYIFQAGIPEWESGTNYYNGKSIVQYSGLIYRAISGTDVSPNVGNQPDISPSNWQNIDPATEKSRALAAEALKLNIANPSFTGTLTKDGNDITPNATPTANKIPILNGSAKFAGDITGDAQTLQGASPNTGAVADTLVKRDASGNILDSIQGLKKCTGVITFAGNFTWTDLTNAFNTFLHGKGIVSTDIFLCSGKLSRGGVIYSVHAFSYTDNTGGTLYLSDAAAAPGSQLFGISTATFGANLALYF